MIDATNNEIESLVREVVKNVSSVPVQRTAPLRAIRKKISKTVSGFSPKSVLALSYSLMDRPEFVYHWFAFEMIENHPATLKSLRAKEIQRLGKGLDSWYSVDAFACCLSGKAWREKQISTALIHTWAGSKNFWYRRAALVSTVPLNNTARGGTGDTKRTLSVCEMLVHDREDMVVKALSWALRELSKKDPKAVQRFVSAHRPRLAPRVIREVNAKLSTGLKNPRRTATKIR